MKANHLVKYGCSQRQENDWRRGKTRTGSWPQLFKDSILASFKFALMLLETLSKYTRPPDSLILLSCCSLPTLLPSVLCRLWRRPGGMALWEALSSLLFRSPWWHRVLGLPRVQTDLRLSGWHASAGWSVCVQGGVSLQIPQQLFYGLDTHFVFVTVDGSCYIVSVNCWAKLR